MTAKPRGDENAPTAVDTEREAGNAEELAKLNPEQRAAVMHDAGPLLVLAGPGTGKTRVIVHRIAHLIEHRGFAPESILAATFTVKAAQELRERLAGLVGASVASRVRAHTLHGFGATLVRRFASRMSLPPKLTMLDAVQKRMLIKGVLVEHGLFPWARARGLDACAESVERVLDQLSDAGVSTARALDWCEGQRSLGATAFIREARAVADIGTDDAPDAEQDVPGARTDSGGDATATALALLDEFEHACRATAAFRELCAERGVIGYGDLLSLPLDLLRAQPTIAGIVKSELRAIVVDEFQDCNPGQIQLLRLVAGRSCDVCVVGDDDQAIYGFRGADERAFERFAELWPTHEVVALTTNYRSTPTIVFAANAVIARACARYRPEKALHAHARTPGPELECVMLDDEAEESQTLAANLLLARASALEENRAWTWDTTAVIARTNTDLDRAADVLSLEGIPWQRAREGQAFEDPGVLDALAWAEWICDADATWAARRILTRTPNGLDPQTVGGWERSFRQQRARHQVDPESAGHPGHFAAWLTHAIARESDPITAGVAERVLDMRASLAKASEEFDAHRALFEIITKSDSAHADLLPPRERARRIGALVALLRIAKERLAVLDQPADLRAFLRYKRELEAIGGGLQSLATRVTIDAETPEETIASGDAPSPEGRVWLLTAHAAKGLEFQNVYLLRVKPQHGFPKTSGPARDTGLPEGLLDAASQRSEKERALDEERRVFYVACTRARDRLVLSSKRSQKPSKSTVNFFEELLAAPEHRPARREVRSRAILDEAGRLGLIGAYRTRLDLAVPGGPQAHDAAERFERLRRGVRAHVAGLLAGAGKQTHTANELERELALAGTHLVLISTAEAGGLDTARDHALRTHTDAQTKSLLERLDAIGTRGASAAQPEGLPAPAAPLRLSFTSVDDYIRCPACWYVRHVLELPSMDDRGVQLGAAVHNAVEEFGRSWALADAEGTIKPTLQALLAGGRRELARLATSRSRDLAEQAAQLESQLKGFHDILHERDAHVLEVEWRIVVPYELDGVTHSLEAKLDRVDLAADGSFRVIDYKTGGPSKKFLEPKGDDLQMNIYAMALRHAQNDPRARGSAEYWVLSTAQRGVLAFEAMKPGTVRGKIDKAVRGMLAGAYGKGKECRGECAVLGLRS